MPISPAVMLPLLTMLDGAAPVPKFATEVTAIPQWLTAIVPLLLMLPRKVVTALTRMPLKPVLLIVPLLVMPPRNVPTVPTVTAVPPALIVPELTMPPPAVLTPNCATLVTAMPCPSAPAEIVPPLLMLPSKVDTPLTRMPPPAAEIVPALLMPPEKLLTRELPLLVPPTKMPAFTVAAMVPLAALTISPENAETPSMLIPCAAVIVPELVMPPEKLSTSRLQPKKQKTEPTRMPSAPDAIVPALLMPPETVPAIETLIASPAADSVPVEALRMPPAKVCKDR